MRQSFHLGGKHLSLVALMFLVALLTACGGGGGGNGNNTPPPPATAPAAPTNLVPVRSNAAITLTWTDASSNETGFELERGIGASPSSWTQVGSDFPANTTTFRDTTTSGSTTYTYRVRAVNAVGPSDYATSSSVVIPVTVASVEAGNRHSLALMSDGTVQAWGGNDNGALGLGDTTDRVSPEVIPGLSGVTAVSAGDGHSLALMENGSIKSWGQNFFGALGNNTTTFSDVPVDVHVLTSGVTAISAGGFYSVALTEGGAVYSWGSGQFGQLGHGPGLVNYDEPEPISTLTSGVAAISAGQNHVLALLENHTVMAWGNNQNGQVGNNSPATDNIEAPVAVSVLTDVIAISAGGTHSLALRGDGTVWAWGGNDNGAVGDGTTDDRFVPVQVSGLEDIVAIAAGTNFSFAVASDGTIYGWGGLPGDGASTSTLTPVVVSGLSDGQTISAGKYHVLTVSGDKTLYSWGENTQGQLGIGNWVPKATPYYIGIP